MQELEAIDDTNMKLLPGTNAPIEYFEHNGRVSGVLMGSTVDDVCELAEQNTVYKIVIIEGDYERRIRLRN